MYNVLFLCSDNSARSQMAECILNRAAKGRFQAYSAGSRPADALHPESVALLSRLNYSTAALRTKSWDEFANPDAPHMDFIFTLCDEIAGEKCPNWPGQPMTAHWGIPDPAATTGTPAEKAAKRAEIFRVLDTWIGLFTCLRMDGLDRLALKNRLDTIGHGE